MTLIGTSTRHRPASHHYANDRVVAVTPLNETRTVEMHDLRLLSNGVFSNVYRGEFVNHKANEPSLIVVKKTFLKADPRTESQVMEWRILKILNRYRHKNVMQLLYSFVNQRDKIYCFSLIFEFMPMTLYTYIREWKTQWKQLPGGVCTVEIKLLAWQLFRGLNHLQDNQIIHRDLKPQNILVDPANGLLKISDFGSSKEYDESEPNHPYHVTRYYRPPELILKAKFYGCEIDIWSAGCIIGEMFKTATFLPGTSTAHQFFLILSILGKPSAEDLEIMKATDSSILDDPKTAKYLKNVPSNRADALQKFCAKLDPEACSFLSEILVYNPKKRLGGRKVLQHAYFKQIFDRRSVRFDGKPISIVSKSDLESAVKQEIEDHSHTGEEEAEEA